MRPLRALLILIAAAAPMLRGQTDTRQIVERSIEVAKRSAVANHSYTYIERDEESHLDSEGHVRSTDVEVSRAILVNGDTFEETISQNGKPPSAQKIKNEKELLQKRQNETPEERANRLNGEKEDRAFVNEVPEGFTFTLAGEGAIDGRPAYIMDALPKPGYHPHSKYGKMFSKVHGKLWVDKQDFGWVKIQADVTEPFSMGFFLARVQKGSRILYEQTRVADGIWLPKRMEVTANAKILFLKDYRLREVISYSDYHPGEPSRPVPENTHNVPPSGLPSGSR